MIYYYWTGGPEFWLFTLYDKDEMADLSPKPICRQSSERC